MGLSIMKKEKEFEYITMKKKALAFEQLLGGAGENRARPGNQISF